MDNDGGVSALPYSALCLTFLSIKLEERANELFEEYYAEYVAAGGTLAEDQFHDMAMGAWNLKRAGTKTTWNNGIQKFGQERYHWRGERPGNWEYQKAVQACLDFEETMEMEDEDDEV